MDNELKKLIKDLISMDTSEFVTENGNIEFNTLARILDLIANLKLFNFELDDEEKWISEDWHKCINAAIKGFGENLEDTSGNLGDDDWYKYSFGYDASGELRTIKLEYGYPHSEEAMRWILLDELGNRMFESIFNADTYSDLLENDYGYSEDGKIFAQRTLCYPYSQSSEYRDNNGVTIHTEYDSIGNLVRVEPSLEFYDADKDEFTTHKKCSELSEKEKNFLAITYFGGGADKNIIEDNIRIIDEYCKIKGEQEVDQYELEVVSNCIGRYIYNQRREGNLVDINTKLEMVKGSIEKIKRRLWIIPYNNLETDAIFKMLGGGEEVLETKQAVGASWDNLEPEIKALMVEAKEKGKVIYGVELQGDSKGAINIYHHRDGKDDRSDSVSSLEQVAEILGKSLTYDEKFIVANAKGYIPTMEKLAAELGLNDEDTQEIIAKIRRDERWVQGVTDEMEAQAKAAVDALGEITEKRDYIQIDLPHSKISTITDRLYGKYDNLLITCGDGKTYFCGKPEIIQMLNERFLDGVPGRQLEQESGFWYEGADQSEIKKSVQELLQKIKNPNKERAENSIDEI